MKNRCAWAKDPLNIEYHDKEWGVPVHDDQKLFEFLILETFQAGLSWVTILKKRVSFKKAFVNFEIEKVANFKGQDVQRLLSDKGIIRNKLKIHAAINNANAIIRIQKQYDSFSKFLWDIVNHSPIVSNINNADEIPVRTDLSDQLSKLLKKHNFNFIGPTTCYAYMQAVGLANDHETNCFRYTELL